GGGNGPRVSPPLEAGRGPSSHAAPGGRRILDHIPALRLLHAQGATRALRRPLPSLSNTTGGSSMTPLRISIFASVAAVLLLFVIFELIRSRRLQERYAMLWLLTGIVLL